MENVIFPSNAMLQKVISWLNVLNVKRKLVLLRRLGRWQAEKTRVERELSSRLDSLSTVEKLTDQS